MSSASGAYRGCRERITELATSASPEELARRVPACPDWTATELLAHIIGVAEDFVAGNLDQVGSDEWTSDHLARRSDMDVSELIAQWATIAAQAEGALDQIPPGAASVLIGDIATHEHDLRGALGMQGARDSDAVWIALDRYVRWFGKRIKDAELPSVAVVAGDRRWQAGIKDPAAEISGHPFELLRALTGRRTTEEIEALQWSGDATPYIDLVPTYPPTQSPLAEGRGA